jgi:hypothetical protein
LSFSKQNILETGSVSVIGSMEGNIFIQFGPLERASLKNWNSTTE